MLNLFEKESQLGTPTKKALHSSIQTQHSQLFLQRVEKYKHDYGKGKDDTLPHIDTTMHIDYADYVQVSNKGDDPSFTYKQFENKEEL